MSEPVIGDAFGQVLLDHQEGASGLHVIERDDGLVHVFDAAIYFSPPGDWPEVDHAVLSRVSGRVLDVGAGAGRHCLALQERGDQPLALDMSPGAVEVCRRRGVSEVLHGSVHDLAMRQPGVFDAIILMGNNVGLLESRETAPVMFDVFSRLLARGGVVAGIGRDPYQTQDPEHLAYHRKNRELGRYPGQVTLRVRYQRLATDWFDYLLVSPDELAELAAGSGWALVEHGDLDQVYWAVLTPR